MRSQTQTFSPAVSFPVSDEIDVLISSATKSGADLLVNASVYNGTVQHQDLLRILRDKQRQSYIKDALASSHVAIDPDALAGALRRAAEDIPRLLAPGAGETGEREESGEPDQVPSLDVPSLVGVARDDDGSPVFLLLGEDGTMVAADHCLGTRNGEAVTFVPPPELPWRLPRASVVLALSERSAESDGSEGDALLADLEHYHKAASDLGHDAAYTVVALFDMATYAIEHADYFPIMLFHGDPEMGKSRTGKAMAHVSRHGIHVVGLREANLLRDAQDRQATLFFDFKSFWKAVEREKCDDVILARCERGAKVARVLKPDAGPHLDTVYYAVFGPTVIATNDAIHTILGTRCLAIDMPLSAREFNQDLRPEDALPLVERLMAWRAWILQPGHGLTACDKPANGRLGDILRILKRVLLTVAPDRAREFDQIVRWQTDRRHADRVQSTEAAILRALSNCTGKVTNARVFLSDVLEVFNLTRPEGSKVTERWLGPKLRGMGFTTHRAGAAGATAIDWKEDLLERLRIRHGLDEQKERPTEKREGNESPDIPLQPSVPSDVRSTSGEGTEGSPQSEPTFSQRSEAPPLETERTEGTEGHRGAQEGEQITQATQRVDLFAGLGADAALARALAHKLASQPTVSALAEQWHSVQTGNYHTLSDDAQRVVRLAYETRGHQLVEGGQR